MILPYKLHTDYERAITQHHYVQLQQIMSVLSLSSIRFNYNISDSDSSYTDKLT
jgi:hypothetical protein